MNPVRIRDFVKELHQRRVFSAAQCHAFLHAPLFIYPPRQENFTPDEMAWFKANLGGGEDLQVPVKLPYDRLILSNPAADEIYFVTSGPHTVAGICNGVTEHRDAILSVLYCTTYDRHAAWLMSSYNGAIANGVMCMAWRDGKSFVPSKTDNLAGIAALGRSVVAQFAFDVMSHFSTVVKVSPPDTPGKSVEWKLARTHYCLIARKQAMLCRDNRRGPNQEEITRAAHWRRAHFRQLSNPRYIHKRGLLVPVKQAWIGPEEWIGLDGKIYKVMLNSARDNTAAVRRT
ncbi:MAG: hypothetical protein KGL39_40125 [Patescibacteria group bacterium]|nr:hypothetical protein [Patescibacteria group bacterium]